MPKTDWIPNLTLTTNGTGAASLNTSTRILNIPTPSSGGGSGTVTSIVAQSPLTGGTITTTGTIGIPVASGNSNGYLAQADYNIFANKIGGASTTSTTTPTIIKTLTQAQYNAEVAGGTILATTIYIIE